MQRGQSLVEFALVLPILLLLLLGALDLGQAYRGYVAITNAAREAARYGAIHPTDTMGIQAHGLAELPADLGGATLIVDCAQFGSNVFNAAFCASPSLLAGDQVRVQVTADFHFLALYLFRIDQVRLSNFAIMAVTGGS